jgi:hypothetical protein
VFLEGALLLFYFFFLRALSRDLEMIILLLGSVLEGALMTRRFQEKLTSLQIVIA